MTEEGRCPIFLLIRDFGRVRMVSAFITESSLMPAFIPSGLFLEIKIWVSSSFSFTLEVRGISITSFKRKLFLSHCTITAGLSFLSLKPVDISG